MADDRFPTDGRYAVTVHGYVKGMGAGGWADMSSEPDGKGEVWSVPTYAIDKVQPLPPVPAYVRQFAVYVDGVPRVSGITWAEAVSEADSRAAAGLAPEIRLVPGLELEVARG